MKRYIFSIFVIFGMLIPKQTHALEKLVVNAKEFEYGFHPAICVLQNNEERCQQVINFEFKEKLPHNICIYQVANDHSKQCIKAENTRAFSYSLDTAQTTELVIEHQETRKVLAVNTFKITQFKPVRKRRRFSWGLL